MTGISATLEDYKRIKTRAAWQIVLEVPEHKFPAVMEALGHPTSGESIWVAVARISDQSPQEQTDTETSYATLPEYINSMKGEN